MINTLLALGYSAYFLYVMIATFDSDDEGDIRLLWVTCCVAVCLAGRFLLKKYCAQMKFVQFQRFLETTKASKATKM